MHKARTGAIQYTVRIILTLAVLFLTAGPSFSTVLPASASPILAQVAGNKQTADTPVTDATGDTNDQTQQITQPEQQPAGQVEVESQAPALADANGDGCTNLADFNALKAAFGTSTGTDSW